MLTASSDTGRYPSAERESSARSERTMACAAAANRNGSVSRAAIAVIRQYIPENQVERSCGVVVFLMMLAVELRADFAPPVTQMTSAPRPRAVLPAPLEVIAFTALPG